MFLEFNHKMSQGNISDCDITSSNITKCNVLDSIINNEDVQIITATNGVNILSGNLNSLSVNHDINAVNGTVRSEHTWTNLIKSEQLFIPTTVPITGPGMALFKNVEGQNISPIIILEKIPDSNQYLIKSIHV